MRLAGSPSWFLSVTNDQAAHVCLYVRDVYSIEARGPDVPPPLVGDLRTAELIGSAPDAAELSDAWTAWWRRLVHVTCAAQLGNRLGGTPKDDLQSRASLRQSVFDPFEEFESLGDYPPLRSAAQQTWRQGVAWTHTHGAQTMRRGSPIPKAVADSISEERQVDPEQLRAAVLVVAVVGKWFAIAEPGVLLCSEEAYFDDTLFSVELKKVFESGLNGPGQQR